MSELHQRDKGSTSKMPRKEATLGQSLKNFVPRQLAYALLITILLVGPAGLLKAREATSNLYYLGRNKSIYSSENQVRHEWRNLDREAKRSYIAAVNCLRHRPSRLGLNQSLYDDFPFVHSRIGKYGMRNPSRYQFASMLKQSQHISQLLF